MFGIVGGVCGVGSGSDGSGGGGGGLVVVCCWRFCGDDDSNRSYLSLFLSR